MKITPRMVKAGYACLRQLPPFNRWRLPDGSRVRFKVNSSRVEFGSYDTPAGKHTICISAKLVRSGQGMLCVIAHEMLHLRQRVDRTESCAMHNKEFRRLALIVCKEMGYQTKGFV